MRLAAVAYDTPFTLTCRTSAKPLRLVYSRSTETGDVPLIKGETDACNNIMERLMQTHSSFFKLCLTADLQWKHASR